MTGQRWRRADKVAPALAALLVNALIGYALLVGLRGSALMRTIADDAPLALFDIQPPVQQPDPARPIKPRPRKEPGGAPPSSRSPQPDDQAPRPSPAATPAPAPLILVPTPAAPVTGAPEATGTGNGQTGASGSGTGGSGSGTGRGAGTGSGEGGEFSPARQTGGRFRNSDFPDWLRGTGRLKIGVRYSIGPSGRVDSCEIIETSGHAEVDDMTCRIIRERYRFRPARDPDGYAVSEVREEDYRWRVR